MDEHELPGLAILGGRGGQGGTFELLYVVGGDWFGGELAAASALGYELCYGIHLLLCWFIVGVGGHLVGVALLDEMPDDEEEDKGEDEYAADDLQLVVVFGYGGEHFVFRHGGLEEVASRGEYGVPDACAEGGVEEELADVHLDESCGDGDKLPNGGNQTADECGYGAILLEVFLGVLYFLAVE